MLLRCGITNDHSVPDDRMSVFKKVRQLRVRFVPDITHSHAPDFLASLIAPSFRIASFLRRLLIDRGRGAQFLDRFLSDLVEDLLDRVVDLDTERGELVLDGPHGRRNGSVRLLTERDNDLLVAFPLMGCHQTHRPRYP